MQGATKPATPQGQTSPILAYLLQDPNAQWQLVKADWFAGKRRVLSPLQAQPLQPPLCLRLIDTEVQFTCRGIALELVELHACLQTQHIPLLDGFR